MRVGHFPQYVTRVARARTRFINQSGLGEKTTHVDLSKENNNIQYVAPEIHLISIPIPRLMNLVIMLFGI